MQAAASHSSRDSRFSQVKRRIMLNLLALGFDSQHLENKYSCRLDDHMFDKPNKRAFEVVFHFLFCQLDRPQAEQLFRLCFPGTDKQSTQEFRKRTYTWLKRIAEENVHSGLSKFSPTLFMSPGGKDFIYLVFAFTQFVLLKLCQAKLPSSHALHRPILAKNRRLASVQQTSLQALASKCHKEHVRDLQLIDKTDRDIHLHFQEQQNSYHKLQREKSSLMQKRTKDKRKLMSESKKQEELEHHCRETKSKCKQVRGMWSKLTNTVAETRPHSEVLSSVYNERNLKLEADKLKLNIPSRLVNEYQEEMYQAVGSSLYQFGKVNLQSIVSVCNFSFMLLGDNLRKFGIPNFESQIPFVKIQSGLHKEELLKIYDIRSEIICLNDSATRNIEQMEAILDEKYKFKLSTFNVLNTTESGELSYALNNDTSTMSNQTILLDTSDESGNSLPLKYLLLAGHDVSSFLSHYVFEPEEQLPQNTTPNVTTHTATQLKPKQTKARSKNKPFSSK
uniref:HAUS augmin-like complex subunit 6 N-terminal domain-containing protein n=1 Tax=Ciona savignyi TaxID=51511 RepID=H2YNP8_CIOSA